MEGTIHKTTILFVDDERRWTEIYVEELEAYGYDVVFKSDVDEAYEYLQSNLPQTSLLILDIMMPAGKDMTDEETQWGLRTGEKFYDKVRRLSSTLPVFILTNVSDEHIEKKFRQELNCTFLRKAATLPHELSEMVRVWCGGQENNSGGTNESRH